MNNYYVYRVKSFSSENLFKIVKENGLKIIEIIKIDEFTYEIKVDFFENEKFLKVFNYALLIKKNGIIFNVIDLFIKKTTIISFIVSLFFFFYLQSLIFDIKIYGQNSSFTNELISVLESYNIKKYKSLPNKDKLISIKEKLISEYDEIENIEIYVNGTIVNVIYYLIDNKIDTYYPNLKHYAKKSGVIKECYIEKGNLLFQNNQYVKQGELLIDDHIIVNDKTIYIGAKGVVYAYTWTTVNINASCSENLLVDTYNKLLIDARYKISKDFKDGEYIDKEKILINLYENNTLTLKIHYTTVENIAIISEK